jgi:hypothetical protein
MVSGHEMTWARDDFRLQHPLARWTNCLKPMVSDENWFPRNDPSHDRRGGCTSNMDYVRLPNEPTQLCGRRLANHKKGQLGIAKFSRGSLGDERNVKFGRSIRGVRFGKSLRQFEHNSFHASDARRKEV